MPRPLSLALDLGTTSVAAIAVNVDGNVCRSVQHPNSAAISNLPAGHAEQDPLGIRGVVIDVLRELASDLPGTPVCLGLTGQMHGVLLVDDNRHPLTHLVTWQDRRCNQPSTRPHTSPQDQSPVTWLQDYLTRCPEDDLVNTGCRPAPGYLGVTLATWLASGSLSQEVLERTRRATFLADWVAAELTDTSIVTDRSNAAASGVFDLANDVWSQALLDAGSIPPSWLPEIAGSGEPLGSLVPEWAAETGLPAGLPICTAIGDNQAAVLGSLPAEDSALQINVGTGGQINWPVPQFARVEGMDTRYLPIERFMLVGAGLAGGDAYAWVQKMVSACLRTTGHDAAEEHVYRALTEAAQDVAADADGLICQPLFRGTRREPHARGTFEGITISNFTPGHIARAVFNGIAEGFAWFHEQATATQPLHATRIVGSGNGLRNNPLLADSLERRFGLPVYVPTHTQEAAFGAALLAGSHCGVWPDLLAAGASIRLEPFGS